MVSGVIGINPDNGMPIYVKTTWLEAEAQVEQYRESDDVLSAFVRQADGKLMCYSVPWAHVQYVRQEQVESTGPVTDPTPGGGGSGGDEPEGRRARSVADEPDSRGNVRDAR